MVAVITPPIVGRQAELECLMDSLAQTISGRGTLISLSGEAGIGKSRLVVELVAKARTAGCQVMVGRCVPGSPIPFLPFLDALHDVLGGEYELAEIMRQETRSRSEVFLLSYLDIVKDLASVKPLILVLEDLHWVDSSSAQLLLFLARHLKEMQVLIIFTYRPEDILLDQSGNRHPLESALIYLHREGLCKELGLQALLPQEVQSLVEGTLGGRVEPTLVERIIKEGEGSPLYTIETTRLLFISESIDLIAGLWRGLPNIELLIPPTIKDVILARVSRLTIVQRKTIEISSVLGNKVNASLICELAGMETERVYETLEELENDHRLLVDDGATYRFVHETVRKVIYDSISTPRRREFHRVVGRILETQGSNRYGELCEHFFQAGINERCYHYSVLAGKECLNGFASPEGVTYFARAIDSLKGQEGSEMVEALEGLADSYRSISHYDQAIEKYELLLKMMNNGSDKVRALRKTAECWLPHGKAEPSKACALIDKAEDLKGIPPLEAARLMMVRGKVVMFTGSFTEARILLEKAAAVFQSGGYEGDLGLCLIHLAELDISMDRIEDAQREAEQARDLFTRHGLFSDELTALFDLGIVYSYQGNTEGVERSFGDAKSIGRKFGKTQQLFFVHVYHAYFLLFQSQDLGRAVAEGRKALNLALGMQSDYITIGGEVILGQALMFSGDLKRAEIHAEAAIALAPSIPTDIKSPIKGSTLHFWSEILMAKGDWDAAASVMKEVKESFKGSLFGRLWLAQVTGRYGQLLALHKLPGARKELEEAISLYMQMGNMMMVRRLTAEIEGLRS